MGENEQHRANNYNNQEQVNKQYNQGADRNGGQRGIGGGPAVNNHYN